MTDQPYTSWQVQSPQADAGGALPQLQNKLPPQISGVPVDRPIPISDIGLQRQISSTISQPDPWVYIYRGSPQPYQGVISAITLVEVDFPPYLDRRWRTNINVYDTAWRSLDAWQYSITGHQPFDSRTGLPVGIRVDDPPSNNKMIDINTRNAINASQPDAWPYVFLGWRQPYQGGRVHVRYGYEAVPTGLARTAAQQASAWASAAPEAWVYAFTDRHNRQPYGGRFGSPFYIQSVVSNPPPALRARTAAFQIIVRSWDAPDPSPFMHGWQPLQSGRLPAAFTSVSVDQPPFGLPPQFSAIYNSWLPGDPPPTLQQKSNSQTFGISYAYAFGFIIG